MSHSLDALFNPSSVALIGASSDPERIGGRPLRFMLEGGFAAPIYPVNRSKGLIQGDVRPFLGSVVVSDA